MSRCGSVLGGGRLSVAVLLSSINVCISSYESPHGRRTSEPGRSLSMRISKRGSLVEGKRIYMVGFLMRMVLVQTPRFFFPLDKDPS